MAKQASWLLRESRELFRSIFFDNSIIGMALLSVNDIILEANQVWCDFLGCTREELIGEHFSAFIHPDDMGLDAGPQEALLRGVIRDYVVEKRYLRRDGGTFWGRMNVSALRDKQGRLRCKLAILEDITPLKVKESEIAAQRCIYDTMLGVLAKVFQIPSSPTGGTSQAANNALYLHEVEWEEMVADEVIRVACCFATAGGGAYFGYNEAGQSLSLVSATGISANARSALAGHSFALGEEEGIVGLVAVTKKPFYLNDASADPRWTFTDPNIRSCYFAPLYYRERLFGVFVLFSDRIDGFTHEQRILADAISFYISAALETARLFASVRDICKMLDAGQEQLLHAQKMEAVGRLAGGIAHALNNQLTVIQASVDLQLPHISRCSPLYRSFLKIRKAAWNSANLARQLMLFGQKHPQFRVILDLNGCLQELREMLERLCGENVVIRFELSGDLRPIMADAANIDQVIINLVLNARDAMPEGGTITIRTENVRIPVPSPYGQNTVEKKDFVCLSVSDTGTGIEENMISCIFEPFFTTKEPGDGAGLGLSVAYGIVKAHGGWINVRTKVGSGTIFEVLLPALDPEESPGKR